MIQKEFTAKTVNDAIDNGLEELKVTKDQVTIEVLEEKTGLFKKSATVRLTVNEIQTVTAQSFATSSPANSLDSSYILDTNEEKSEDTPSRKIHENDKAVVDYITLLLDKMGLDCTLTIKSNRDVLTIIIGGTDVNLAIGYHGETLDNLQYLCLLTANKNTRFKKKLIIDAEGYREIRTAQLTELSKKLAFKVSKSNTAVELEPMNPYERRVIHTALQDDKYVTTSSEGTEPNRYVVISPAKKEDLMYDSAVSKNFKQNGIKTRSFGQKPKRF